ncbi:glycoside hydrolase family 26 protein [Streptomyces phyllanthi]|uniref:GH26 domain-containing protein n=1 Tax=Streptomyces phyllanthi TaxID=1803180 RepID=A0A5N8WGD8_9ACTN|nr:glycosyl hydrolase [Streptomyces phyllanthi]MPY45936.1 hypothetical protein [Streptomyces phyllanthi]
MAAEQRRRRRWPVYVAVGIAASSALLPGAGYAVGAGTERAPRTSVPASTRITKATGTPSAPSASPEPSVSPAQLAPSALPAPLASSASPTSSAPPASSAPKTQSALAPYPAFGAYLDYGPVGVTRMALLSRWLGGAQLRVGHTYLPGDRWSNIEGAPRFLDAWAKWRRARSDRILVLNVPMLERNEQRLTDTQVRALLRRGAAGEFDAHYRRLAQRLVGLRVPDTVIVLGWEMNGITYSHRCGPDPQSWKAYWNRIVTAMRAVPGQRFRFDFTPSRGRDAVPWTECYPGDATVDIIGMDAYDQPRGLSFDQQVAEPYGLQKHVDFAKEHGKPISYPEWGLFRNGDNAEYMRRMLAWIDQHRPLYNTVTDYCPHGVWQCRRNPKASAVYRSVLHGRIATRPAPQLAPGPLSPANCFPLNLSGWIEHWIGGALCVRYNWWARSWLPF